MDWETFNSEIQKLSNMVKNRPDYIVAIARGGLIPGRVLAKELGDLPMYCMSVQKNGNHRETVTQIAADLTGKKILVVEDMIESGRSLEAVCKYLENKGAGVETTCMYTTPGSVIRPDYRLREVNTPILFPWE